jgi:excinuclease ABC subunit A
LYARVGVPHCPICKSEIKKLSNEEIINFVLEKITEYIKKNFGSKKELMGVVWDEAKVSVLSPLVRGRKGEHYQMLYDLLGKGFQFVRVDGNLKNLRERIELSKNKNHNIDVLVDTLSFHEFKDSKDDAVSRLSESIERALNESDGLVTINFNDKKILHYQLSLRVQMMGFLFQK